jgi:integrase
MPKRVAPLSEARVRNAKAKYRDYRLSDGDGLYLLVKKSGSRLWRFDFTNLAGKRNTLAFGKYPDVSLALARERRGEARQQLTNNIDPGAVRNLSKEESFEPVALEWLKKQKAIWSDSHAKTTFDRLNNNIFPWLGTRPVKEISAPELLSVLRRIEARGAIETAHRCRSICGQVFKYAIATGRAERDVSADLQGALQPVVKSHHSAILEPKQLPPLLKAIDGYSGHFIVRCALRLAPMLFQRPGEMRFACWSEIDFESATWAIPIEKMKLKKTEKVNRAGEKHVVPLSRQAMVILKELYPLTGRGTLVFPSVRIAPDTVGSSSKPISENTLNAALRNLGYDKDTMTTHGWRSIARSLLDEVLGHKPTAIERQLFHAVADPLGEAYNRAQHLDERRAMMQRWADYLDGLRNGAKVISLYRTGTE